MTLVGFLVLWFMAALVLYECVMPSLPYAIIFGAILTPLVVLIGQVVAG